MKAQIRMIIASVIVIALALTAVSGITYSWFSDTEEAKIEITTAKVDYAVTWAENGSSDVGTSWTKDSSSKTISISGLAANAAIPVVTKIENDSTIKTVYRIVATPSLGEGHNYTLYDLKNIYIGGKQLNATSTDGRSITLGDTVLVDWTLLAVDTDPSMQTISITTPWDYGGDVDDPIVAYDPTTGEGSATKGGAYTADWENDVREGLTITLSVVAAQGDYPTETLDTSGTAIIPVNGVIKGSVSNSSEETAKDMDVTVNFSNVGTYRSDSFGGLFGGNVVGTKILIESEATGDADMAIGSVATVKLTLLSYMFNSWYKVSNPTFNSAVIVTAVIKNVDSDPGTIEISCNGSTEGIETISSIYDATAQTLTVTFSTTHFSQFSIDSVGENVAKIGDKCYGTLISAIEAYSESDYEAGRALVLMTDFRPPATYQFDKDIIIDLNENTFYFTKSSDNSYNTQITGNFTLMNGNVVRETNAGFGHFTIEDNEKEVNVTFEDITYTNNYPRSTTGSPSNTLKDAIKVSSRTANNINLTIKDCTFTDGGIYLCGGDNAKTVTTSISGCTFKANEASYMSSGFVYIDCYDYTTNVVTITDCSFEIGVTSNVDIIKSRTSDSNNYGSFSLTFSESTVKAYKSTAEGAEFNSSLIVTVVGGTNITVNDEKVTDNTQKKINCNT